MAERNGDGMHHEAVIHLSGCDPRLGAVIARVGACRLRPQRGHFTMLCKAIVSQQLSTKAARTIFTRYRELFPRKRPTPAHVLDMKHGDLRKVGLSTQKTGYLFDLAVKLTDGTIPRRRLSKLPDEDVVAALTQVKGIGVWTAQMFLIFVLNRPDVWPTDDLGVRKAAMNLYGYKTLPGVKRLNRLAKPWRPYRSVASWYLWRSLENAPMS